MRHTSHTVFICLLALITVFILQGCYGNAEKHILVFSKTEGYRHESIPDAHLAIRDIGRSMGARVDSTEDSSAFTAENLANYDLVVFAMTTGDVFDAAQQAAFESFIRDGGGYVGIHSASDTEYDWPWYGKLVGGYFDGHPNDPNVRPGLLVVDDPYHISTNHLRFHWNGTDEWYDIKERNPDVKLLVSAVDSTYKEEWTEDRHPISWYHEYDGGRAFYTAIGHTSESYYESEVVQHLRGGIEYALGLGDRLPEPPAETSFEREVLADTLNEPMELAVLPDGRIAFIERPGDVWMLDPAVEPASNSTGSHDAALIHLGRFDVTIEGEDGLLGFALDPAFDETGWMYFYYSPADTAVNRLSRITFADNMIDFESEAIMLEVPVFRGCCHSGGSIEFDSAGNLYLATGDDTNPFASDGRAPIDEQEGRETWNAQRSAANTMDLRGKILRIKPEPDGSYSIPAGNLAEAANIEARPEIYTMGHRNPFRISIDSETGFLYWGDIGPDADFDSERGPRGYDEFGQAKEAGNFGWPYVIADNKPYRLVDFATGELGDWFDPANLRNESRLNTGARSLPSARPAMIWYPYNYSAEFPMLSGVGRSAMAGPVFHRDEYRDSDVRFPKFFDGKLFIYEWMRHWIKVVTLDRKGRLLRIEDFVPSMPLNRPTDLAFGPDGALYMLEYGTVWSTRNPEARLSRIVYRD